MPICWQPRCNSPKGHLGGQKRPNFSPEHASAPPWPRIAGGKKAAAGPAPLPGRAAGPAFGPALGLPAFREANRSLHSKSGLPSASSYPRDSVMVA